MCIGRFLPAAAKQNGLSPELHLPSAHDWNGNSTDTVSGNWDTWRNKKGEKVQQILVIPCLIEVAHYVIFFFLPFQYYIKEID